MKLIFILLTAYTLYLMRCKESFSSTYEKKADKHPFWMIYLIGIVLTFFIHTGSGLTYLLRSYSVWLESMAIIPQMILKINHVSYRKVMRIYICLLVLYKFFYLILWVYKLWNNYNIDYCAVAGGILQLVLYMECVYKISKPKK